MNKKVILGLVALIIAIAIIIFLVLLTKINPQEKILLKDETILPAKVCLELNKVTVIHEAGCPACAQALPSLKEIEQEQGLKFTYYDLTITQDKEKILGLNLVPVGVPTLIANCEVYIGSHSKDEFKNIILG